MDIRDKIEARFSRFGHLIFRRAWLFLVCSVLVTAAMVSFLPEIQMDTSAEGLLHKADPALLTYKNFREQFGSDRMIILGITPPDVFDLSFLQKLKKFHLTLEQEVSHLYNITSLVNAEYIQGKGDDLVVEDLLDRLPVTENELRELRQRIMSHPLHRGRLISDDGEFTIIILKPMVFSQSGPVGGSEQNPDQLLSQNELAEFYSSVQKVCTEFAAPEFHIFVGGEIAAEQVLSEMTFSTMGRFTIITSLLIIAITGLLFRRLSGVIFPLLVVNCALFSTLGLMAFFQVPMTLNSTILPSFLLAVGIGDSVHILTIFYRHFDKHNDQEEAIAFTLGHSGLAVVMTSLTTAGGLLSFVTAGIEPVAELGIFAAGGVMLALAFSLTTLPALLAATPIRKSRQGASTVSVSGAGLDRFLGQVGDFAVSHPRSVVATAVFFLLGSLVLALQLHFSHNSLIYLPEDMEVRLATEMIDAKMNGSLGVEILIDTGRENGLYDREVMERIEKIQQLAQNLYISGLPVGKSISVVDTIKDMNQAVHGGEPTYFKLPENRELIAQELLLFEIGGGDNLHTLIDGANRQARITFNVPWRDAVEYNRLLTDYEQQVKKIFGDRGNVTITGLVTIISRTLSTIISTMATSYVIAGLVITLLMILLIGNLQLGLISMLPNFLPIIMGLGFMKLVDIPLDYTTIMVGGIAIGLAVDDTVHFMHNFRRYYAQTRDTRKAVYLTLTSTGRAMLFTTMILSAGFFILLLAELKSTGNFGLITGFTICMALLADFLLAPALMALFTRP